MSESCKYNSCQRGSEEKMVTGLAMNLVTCEVRVLKKPISPEAGDKE